MQAVVTLSPRDYDAVLFDLAMQEQAIGFFTVLLSTGNAAGGYAEAPRRQGLCW
jgi:hypothetical protein